MINRGSLYPSGVKLGHYGDLIILDETEDLSLEAQAETATQRDLV